MENVKRKSGIGVKLSLLVFGIFCAMSITYILLILTAINVH